MHLSLPGRPPAAIQDPVQSRATLSPGIFRVNECYNQAGTPPHGRPICRRGGRLEIIGRLGKPSYLLARFFAFTKSPGERLRSSGVEPAAFPRFFSSAWRNSLNRFLSIAFMNAS